MKNKGITLIELLIIVSIIGILVIAMGFSYVGWIGRYRVESTVKNLYSDLMDARGKAMQSNATFLADFNTPAPPAGFGTYRIASDTNGNGVIDAGEPLPTFPKTVNYAINWSAGGAITFDKRGTVSPNGTIFFTLPADVNPDYDCIDIFSTRIKMGKMDGGVCNVR